MRNNKRLIAASLIFVIGISVFGLSHRTVYAKWINDDDGIHYIDESGDYVTGFQTIDDEKYYFDKNGNLLTGKIYVQDEDFFYYADSDGIIQKDFIQLDNSFYIADADGKLLKGFQTFDGNRYYFNSKAELQHGWISSGGKVYYANEDGRIQTGFATVNDTQYYLDGDGVRSGKAVLEFDGVTYIINSDGSVNDNAMELYEAFVEINKKRKKNKLKEFDLNERLQSCAKTRAENLAKGYELKKDNDIISLLSDRGVKCKGGYELSYGGVKDYNIECLIEDMKQDENFTQIIKDKNVVSMGMASYHDGDLIYYDLIFIKK